MGFGINIIERRLSFMTTGVGLIIIILFGLLIIIAVYIKLTNAKSLGIAIPVTVSIWIKVFLKLSQEISEFKKYRF